MTKLSDLQAATSLQDDDILAGVQVASGKGGRKFTLAALKAYLGVGSGGGGTTDFSVTFAAAGGAAPGTSFNGSVARTIDYSTVGAAPSVHTHDDRYYTIAQTDTAISTAISGLIDAAPGTLDTLNELAAALGDDPNFAGTVTTSLAGKQAGHANLTALSGLVGASDRLPYFTGSGAMTLATFTAFGRSLVDDADATTARATLGLATVASSGSAADLSGTLATARLDSNIKTRTITFVIDGGGAAITAGQKGHLEIPFNCTIQGWTLLADQAGSAVIDVWKDTYANFPPTVADTIAGTEKPTLSSAQKNQDLSLSSWNTTINAGDILAFNVDSASTVQRLTLSIRILVS